MSDLISREALRNVILNDRKLDGANANWEVNRILVHIDNAPTVEIPTELCKGCRFLKDCETCEEKLRPQGEWGKIGEIGLAYKCNKCGEVSVIPTNFCPNCGAEMRGDAKND